MIEVFFNNVNCRLLGAVPEEVLQEMYNKLSYKVAGAQFSPKFKQRIWDGYKRLFSLRTKIFPTGLFPYVRDILQEHNIQYHIRDQREKPVLGDRLSLCGITPRDYQAESTEKLLKATRGVCKMATGSGKSVVIADVISQLNIPTMIYIHKKDIFFQLHRNLTKWLNIPIGLIGAGHQDLQRINICMVQTVKNVLGIKEKKTVYEDQDNTDVDKLRIKKLIEEAECIITDEAHHESAATYQKINQASKGAYFRYGFTATNWREDNADLLIEAYCTRPIVNVSASCLIQRGFLSKPTIYMYHLSYPLIYANLKHSPYPEIYKALVVDNRDRHYEIAKVCLKALSLNKRVLIAVRRIDHGTQLLAVLHKYCSLKDKAGIIFVKGDTEDSIRREALGRLDTGDLRCVIATSVWGEGIDCPGIDLLINCKAQKSSIDAFQLLGRALRRTPSKSTVSIVDIYDEGKYLTGHSRKREAIYKTEEGYSIKHISNLNEIEL